MTAMRMSAKTPIDLVAFASLALGFHPRESVVMLGIGGVSMHARIDFPDSVTESGDEVALALADPASRNGVGRAVIVIYTERDLTEARNLWSDLDMRFTMAGIEVAEALIVQSGRWYAARAIENSGDADISVHPFIVQAIADGRVTVDDRESLRNQLMERDTVDILPKVSPTKETMLSFLERAVSERTMLTTVEIGMLLVGVRDGNNRDTVTRYIVEDRERAKTLADVFADVTARAPKYEDRANAAALFALASLMVGNGAASWVGIDVVNGEQTGHSLGGIVEQLLNRAVSPDAVREMFLSAYTD